MKPIQLTIHDVAYRGQGVARNSEGKICFIPYTDVGETISAQLVSETKSYRNMELVEVLTPSPHRIDPACPYSKRCPGCCYQHLDYPHELMLKNKQLEAFLRRVPTADSLQLDPPVPSPTPLHYRNKLTLRVQQTPERVRIGYTLPHQPDNLLPIDFCPLACDAINARLHELTTSDPTDLPDRIIIRSAADSTVHLIRPDRTHPDIIERTSFGDIEVPADGFFQVNPAVNHLLHAFVSQLLKMLSPKFLLDLYCGAGAFTFLAASAGIKNCTGVDTAPALIEAARRHADFHHLKSLHLLRMDALQGLRKNSRRLQNDTSLLLVDPPRSGLRKEIIRAILQTRPAHILYISCAADTLSRDLTSLCKDNYTLIQARLFDMFPRTYCFETVTLLKRNN